jgi:hypothetical protein
MVRFIVATLLLMLVASWCGADDLPEVGDVPDPWEDAVVLALPEAPPEPWQPCGCGCGKAICGCADGECQERWVQCTDGLTHRYQGKRWMKECIDANNERWVMRNGYWVRKNPLKAAPPVQRWSWATRSSGGC